MNSIIAKIESEQKKKEDEARLREAESVIKETKTELVALVTFDEAAMKVGGSEKKAGPPRPKLPGGKPEAEPPMVQSCARGQGEIFGVLGKHLGKINVCVQDEKSRDAANLPNSITLSFVVKPDGSAAHEVERRGPAGDAEAIGADAGSDLAGRAGPEFFAA